MAQHIFIDLHERDLLILLHRVALVHDHLGENAFDVAFDRIFAIGLQRAGGVERLHHRAFHRFGHGDCGRGEAHVQVPHHHRRADEQSADGEPASDGAAVSEFPKQCGHSL